MVESVIKQVKRKHGCLIRWLHNSVRALRRFFVRIVVVVIKRLKVIRLCCMKRIWKHRKATVRPRSSDPFYIVTYYIKWVTTSWTDGT